MVLLPDSKRVREWGLFAIVFLSGAVGLLYQVVWHKYMALLLGSHARATAFVLAIFLGGLSAGYATFGRWASTRRWNLVRTYAFIEMALLAWAILFPVFFAVLFPIVSHFYHAFGVSSALTDVLLALVLLGPPTFLMGGTLPLLTQALSPDLKSASYWHARIYGFNTVGAAFGSLFTGYFLVPQFGLSGALWLGAVGNGVVAGVLYFFYAPQFEPAPLRASRSKAKTKTDPKEYFWERLTVRQKALLGVGFLSGFYVLTLETVLIRLMGLATGASTFNFTLIVSVFVFALGIGSLLVRRLEKAKPAMLFWNQIFVALALLVLYVSGEYWPYWAHVLRAGLRDIEQNFGVYQFRLALGVTALLAVPVGLCGLCLPLCFHLFKEDKERLGQDVGYLYGVNTVGAVVGALVGGYYLYYVFNLDHIFKITIGLSVLSAGLSYWAFPQRKKRRWDRFQLGAALAVVVVVLGVARMPLYTKENYIQPFRKPLPIEGVTFEGKAAFTKYLSRNTTYLHYEDGPNTSIGIGKSEYNGEEFSRTLFVNGKSDGNTRGDLFTTVMLGHIPGILARKLTNTAVIGFGTGMTIGVLSLYDEIDSIDVMEISHAVIKNSNYFDRYNGGASSNTKVHIHEMDAFRFLAAANKSYDLIVSEPSNPWVAGVENLYTSEFYRIAKKKMNPDGVFVQWIHTYSFTDSLLRLVLRTMNEHFRHVSIFQLKGGDIALLGRDFDMERADFQRAEARFSNYPPVRNTLDAYGITRLETLLALEIVPPQLAISMGGAGARQTLDHPRLSEGAGRAFFYNASVDTYEQRRKEDIYYAAVDGSLLSEYLGGKAPDMKLLKDLSISFCDHAVSKIDGLCKETVAMAKVEDAKSSLDLIYGSVVPTRDLAKIGAFHNPPKRGFGQDDLHRAYEMFDVFKAYYSPIAHISVPEMVKRMDFCLRSTGLKNTIHGECLLQKILLMQMVHNTDQEFQRTVDQYYAWFRQLGPEVRNYSRFKEARDILDRLVN
ncbi:MAG: hypothetical protein KDD51_07300 [Bdellovibrionales bacterium]|nr:hypothetical protein [Bdellovibrionales bacterium]